VYSTEERLMRDCVTALDGAPPGGGKSARGPQLRVNPAWSVVSRPVTVHSQGGCPMATIPEHGVTDATGQVHGYQGLYVLDASIFPRSVGVNPSATIAAIAERNVESYIRSERQDKWHAPEWNAAWAWCEQRRAILDPITRIESSLPHGGVKRPAADPIGLAFDEAMEGFHADYVQDLTYERAEELGRFENSSIRVELHAQIGDLAKMLDDKKHRVALSGKVLLENWPGPPTVAATPYRQEFEANGSLRLLTGRPGRGAAQVRMMRYHLAFGEHGKYVLRGFKKLLGRDGTDAWQDTTTLFIAIRNRLVPGFRRRGIVRVGIEDLLKTQLPSFKVSGTADDERIGWAFGAFASFFFSNLEKVYLPEVERLRRSP
jgi:cholesterol oxidase